MPIKECFLDLETTGTDWQKNGIWQIGGLIRIADIREEFEFKCDIFEDDEIMETAFEKTGIKPEDLREFPDPFETYEKLIKILEKHINRYDTKDKFFFINFGAEFDYKFLRRWFESMGDDFFGSWFWAPPIEVMSLAMEALKYDRHKMQNFQLGTVAAHLGIPVQPRSLHTALYDAKIAQQVYDICCVKINDDIPF